MNLNFEYTQTIDSIKEKFPHIVCKYCIKPLVNPYLCENCCDFMCEVCPSTNITNRCCDIDKEKKTNNNDNINLLNGKGSIAKVLEELEIYCAVNKINGCQWIGKRSDYILHYNECIQEYDPCIFGCGKNICKDDINHYAICIFFNKWLDNDNINDLEFRKKCLIHIKYNRCMMNYIFDKIKKTFDSTELQINKKVDMSHNEILINEKQDIFIEDVINEQVETKDKSPKIKNIEGSDDEKNKPKKSKNQEYMKMVSTERKKIKAKHSIVTNGYECSKNNEESDEEEIVSDDEQSKKLKKSQKKKNNEKSDEEEIVSNKRSVTIYLKSLSVTQLKYLCDRANLTKNGNKQDLIDRIKTQEYKIDALDNMIKWYDLTDQLTLNELKLICDMLNISSTGTKEKIIEKILNKNANFKKLIDNIYENGYNKKYVLICNKGHIQFINKEKNNQKCMMSNCKSILCSHKNLFYNNDRLTDFYSESEDE
jgi:hypothetical protein